MKKTVKTLLSFVLTLVVICSLSACSGALSNSEWNNDISTVQRKKSEAHSPLSSYKTVEDTTKLSLKDENNSNYMSLNGTWDFAFVTKVTDIPSSFVKAAFTSASGTVTPGSKGTADVTWGEITVPGVWETQGYGNAVYTPLSRYPWDSSVTPASAPENNEIGLYRRTF